uniref:Uncharacterized protein n=1 Tax=Cacopsylla melanoneura TaxID=428564 RepID=A0A8D9BQ19_9HEMI
MTNFGNSKIGNWCRKYLLMILRRPLKEATFLNCLIVVVVATNDMPRGCDGERDWTLQIGSSSSLTPCSEHSSQFSHLNSVRPPVRSCSISFQPSYGCVNSIKFIIKPTCLANSTLEIRTF